MLTREQLKTVMGGSGDGGANCCAHTSQWGNYQCGIQAPVKPNMQPPTILCELVIEHGIAVIAQVPPDILDKEL